MGEGVIETRAGLYPGGIPTVERATVALGGRGLAAALSLGPFIAFRREGC
jgi:hypothetical protein